MSDKTQEALRVARNALDCCVVQDSGYYFNLVKVEDARQRIQAVLSTAAASGQADAATSKHSHYFKNVEHLKTVDVYRVLHLFGVTDQAIGHAIKKLLVAGGRGAGKDIQRDIQEAIDSLLRWQEMQKEDTMT